MSVLSHRRPLYRRAEPSGGLRRAGLLFLVYLFAVWSGVTWCRTEVNSTVFWAANGVLAAGLLLLPFRLGLGFLAGCVVLNVAANVIVGLPGHLNLVFTVLNVALSLATAWLVRLYCGAATDLGRWNRFLRFLAIVAVTSTVEGGVGAAVVGGDVGGFLIAWLRWIACDMLGLTLALPATLMVMRGVRPLYAGPARPPEQIALFAALGGSAYAAFSLSTVPAFLLLYPAIVMAAFRLGSAWIFPAVWVVAQAATVRTLDGAGPLAIVVGGDLAYPELGLHIFLLTLVLAASLATSALAERLRAEQRLRRRESAAAAERARAEDAAEVRRKFLAVMSHEIRTPLNGVMGYREALVARPDLDAEARRQLDMIGRSTEALLRLVDDILDFSRIDAGRLELDPRPTEIEPVLRRAVEVARPDAEAKGLSLTFTAEGLNGCWASADERRLGQTVLNLVSNAVKFTPDGAVSVRAERVSRSDGDGLRVRVLDTGVGVPAAKAAELFKPFGQLDSSLTRRFEGAGLGLAVARAVVERMGGTVAYAPRPGGGSEFRIEIPLERTSAPDAAGSAVVEPEPETGRPLRILVVDDHPVNREVARLILTVAGCETSEAEDGAQAVEAVRRSDFDAVLMDVRMPVMDGLAATRAIRALDGPARRVPIVALTADTLREDVERCWEAGMDGHVAKPVNQAVLLQALSAALDRAAIDEAAAAA